MVSQFISPANVRLLGDIDFDFPPGTHAIGRLDSDSEGLLILTTNKKVTRLLFQGDTPHKRTYIVRVSGNVNAAELHKLRTGVNIPIHEGMRYITPPCDANVIDPPAYLLPYQLETNPHVPHSWLSITLTEGKFRQVRKMTEAIRHRCKRLIRISIEDLHLGDLAPGCVLEIQEDDFFRKLKINNT